MKTFFISITFLLITSCAHHKDVRPNSNGIHLVKIQTENKSEGYSNAKRQAEHYCEQNGKRPFIVKEAYIYSGDIDEQTYKRGKMAAKIATGIGSAGYVFGGKKEKNAGGVVGIGGGIADRTLGNGYTYSMTFRCK